MLISNVRKHATCTQRVDNNNNNNKNNNNNNNDHNDDDDDDDNDYDRHSVVTTNKLLSSNLKGETEGLLVAAQDQAINTRIARNCQKVICGHGQQVESKYKMCSQHEETVDHTVSGREVLSKTEYISRHNNAAAYLHWSICKDHDIKITDKMYQHEPETVVHYKDNNISHHHVGHASRY